MKKKRLSFYCIILLMFCQVLPVFAEEKTEYPNVVSQCEEVKEILRNLQREDSRVRVFLGSYYETILTKYVKKLNLRLVENNLSQTGLIEGQASIVSIREEFIDDYIRYQKKLEDLITVDCKTEPEKFYNGLEDVREERSGVREDVVELRKLILKHRSEVLGLKAKIEKSKTSDNEEGEL